MRMKHALHIGSRFMNGAMNDVTGFVDVVIGVGLPQDIAFDADLDQAGGGDLLVEKTVEIDQQMVVVPGMRDVMWL